MSLYGVRKHYTKDSLKVIKRQVVKCYLECHLAHKDGSKNVVGDGEKDSFLDQQTGGRIHSQKEELGQLRILKPYLLHLSDNKIEFILGEYKKLPHKNYKQEL